MNIFKNKKINTIVFCILFSIFSVSLALSQDFLPRKWNTRKVDLSFNRYYDWNEVETALRTLEKAYPKFLKLRSIGKSHQGRELWYMTINNPDTGEEMSKCAMYIDANIHGNEIQGGEIGIYTIWYLMENYAYNDYIRKLVDERVFYIFPSVNPDGRDLWLHLGGAARSGQVPMDDDNDGLYDEDGPEDLDGDPIVTVNGNPATVVSGTKATNFTCEYVVLVSDPLGAATITISGFDAAGRPLWRRRRRRIRPQPGLGLVLAAEIYPERRRGIPLLLAGIPAYT